MRRILLACLMMSALAVTAAAADGGSIEGCWVAEVGRESYVFRITDGPGGLACMTHTMRGGKQTMQMPASEAEYDAPRLRLEMPTGVTYSGEVDFERGIIEGGIRGRDGKGMDMPLTLMPAESLPGLLARPAAQAPGPVPPVEAGDGWSVGGMAEAGLDPAAVGEFIDGVIAGEAGLLHSCLVARSGRLVVEEYFHGYGADDLHPLASACKSVSSLLVGAAVDDGRIACSGDPLARWFPADRYPRGKGWADPTLADLLSMSLGLDWSAAEAEGVHGTGEEFFARVLGRDVVVPPGERWLYVNAEADLLSGVLLAATGKGPEEWAAEKLFGPLEIESWRWSYGAEGEHRLMDGSLHLRPRDMLKIGQMVLDGGVWKERRVISGEWIAESTARRMSTGGPDGYGYMWWRMILPAAGGGIETIAASGWGSQFICVIPDLDAVAVLTGGNQDNGMHLAPGLLLARTIVAGMSAAPSGEKGL